MSGGVATAQREGCLRCAPAPGRIRAIAGDTVATCASCGRQWLRLPLFAVSGATGVGKTTATESLTALVPQCVRLDGDLLWRHEYLESEESTASFYETWLRFAVELNQHGRPLVFSGAVLPARWEPHPLRDYLATIQYLALVCEPHVYEARFRGRGHGSMDDTYFLPSLRFNHWLRENGRTTTPPMDVLDTTDLSPAETMQAVAEWVRLGLEA